MDKQLCALSVFSCNNYVRIEQASNEFRRHRRGRIFLVRCRARSCLPVSYEGTVSYGTGTGAGAMAIVDASRNMELYEEETDAEVYKIGIHTLPEFTAATDTRGR